MARWSIAFTALTLTAGISFASAGAGEAVDIARVTPRVAFGPVDVKLLVQVEPHPENRRLHLVLDSEALYRSSETELEGVEAPKSHFVSWRAVPPGDYLLTATVYRTGGKMFRSQRKIRIYSAADPDLLRGSVGDPSATIPPTGD